MAGYEGVALWSAVIHLDASETVRRVWISSDKQLRRFKLNIPLRISINTDFIHNMNLRYSASVSHVTRAALTNECVKREEGPSITGSCFETDLTKSVLKRIKWIPPSISFDGAHVLQTTQITSQTKAQLHISAEAHRGQIHRNEGLDKSIMISQFQSAAVCTFQAQPSH